MRPSQLPQKHGGFTLVEMIAGIVALSLAFSIIFTIVLPASEQSASQVQQIRAAELGQSLINEISGRRYDEQSTNNARCGESGISCTPILNLGLDGEIGRANFDDVDDYNGYRAVEDGSGNAIGSLYSNFSVQVGVAYDGDYDFILNEAGNQEFNAKLITVTVTTPSGDNIVFQAYRGNF